MMANQIRATGRHVTLAQILFDPLSYIHPQRLRLPRSIDTPRQRAIVNRMLLDDYPDCHEMKKAVESYPHRLLQHWQRLPYVCSLVGAQLLKPDLAWRGRSLQLPMSVRFFMSLPLSQMIAASQYSSDAHGLDWTANADPQQQVLKAGLSHILDWQRHAPKEVLHRMQLLFSPQLDTCFDGPRKPLQATDLFLISQAIQYAKNHPYHV